MPRRVALLWVAAAALGGAGWALGRIGIGLAGIPLALAVNRSLPDRARALPLWTAAGLLGALTVAGLLAFAIGSAAWHLAGHLDPLDPPVAAAILVLPPVIAALGVAVLAGVHGGVLGARDHGGLGWWIGGGAVAGVVAVWPLLVTLTGPAGTAAVGGTIAGAAYGLATAPALLRTLR